MSIKVSVCIPVYGVEKYIDRCARSLFEQTMRDGIEFIFVNDCTPDKSIEILEQILSEYPHRQEQTKIIHHKQNGGLVAARNTGLSHASGEYIIHCDSDDWVELDMYEKMYLAAKEADADMVYCDYVREMPENKNVYSGGTSLSAVALQNEIADRKTMGTLWNRLYRREIASADYSEVCPDNIIFCEDMLRNMFMLQCTKKIVHVSQALYHYAYNPNSITHTQGQKLAENAYASQKILEKYFHDEKYRISLDYRRRYVLFLAISFNVISIWKSYKAYWLTHLRMWKDSHFSFKAKCIFYLACINFNAASYIYRKTKGIK